jgi:hypothetical protein
MSNTVAQLRTRMPRIAESAFERARLTVVPRRRTRAARMPFVALVSMVLLSGVVGLLLFNTSMQQASFAASALEDQATTLAARQQTLQMDLDRLRDPQRIAEAAVRLGMVQSCNPAFLELGTGKVVGQPSAGGSCPPLRLHQLPKKPPVLDPPTHVVTVPASDTASDTASDAASDTASDTAGSGSSADSADSGDTARRNAGNAARHGKNHQ